MKDEIQNENEQQQPVEISRGQRLAEARMALGIELEELASQIRVPVKVLKDIEADNISANLPETFVRGYIRSFAKKVNVDESLVLTEIETTAASSPDAMKMQSFSKRSKRKRIERRLTIISWLIVAILGVAVIFWWYQTKGMQMLAANQSGQTDNSSIAIENKDADTASEVTVNEAVDANMAESLATESTVANDSAELTEEQANASNPVNDATTEDVAPVAQPQEKRYPESALRVQGDTTTEKPAATTEANVESVDNTEQETNQAAINIVQPSQPEVVTQVANDDAQEAEETVQAPVVLSDEQKRLLAENGESDEADFLKAEFKFEQEVWVEVYDAYDERIAIGNKPAGYLMTLNAQGPFSVLLGSTYGVTIWVNGKEFDLSQFPTSRVARFELDAQP